MKRILFIHHAAGWGGAPNSMIKTITELDKTKFKPFVLLLKDSIVREKLEENNIPYQIAASKFYKKFYKYYTHTIPSFTKWYNFYGLLIQTASWILSRYYFASKELKNIEFDIVHLNSSVLTDWLAPCKVKGKVIIHIREPVSKGYFGIRHRFFKKQMQKYADRIIAISWDNAKRVGVPEKTSVVYNYTTIPDIEPAAKSYSSKKILYVGGSSYIKGFYTLVDALGYLDDDIHVIFAGYYPAEMKSNSLKQRIKLFLPAYKELAKALVILRNSKIVIKVGLVPDISCLLDEVCCLVSPCTVEHFPRPVIEAFAYHKPVIAANIEGMTEIVDDKIDGLLVAKDNPKALAEVINYLCNDPARAKKMGEAGYQKAVKLFTPANIYQITSLYDLLLK